MAQDQNPTIQIKDDNSNVIIQATRKGGYTVIHYKMPGVLVHNKKKEELVDIEKFVVTDDVSQRVDEIKAKINRLMLSLV